MAASPILLVADDLSLIASVKRVLAREGYEIILATSAADAVIAFGHALPGLVLLQPSVESERGSVVLEELKGHPDAQLLRVVLLGEGIPGFDWTVEPTPIDAAHLSETIERNVRTASASGQWSVIETSPKDEGLSLSPTLSPAGEGEEWRTTPPSEPTMDGLEEKLFGDLAADVEAEAMQSVESALPPSQNDDELEELEAEVLAEAHRRRQSRDSMAVKVKPAPPTPPPPPPSATLTDEDSFSELSDSVAPPPSRASHVLARAEQMVLEARAEGDAARRAEESETRRRAADDEVLTRRVHQAENENLNLRQVLEAEQARRETLTAADEVLSRRVQQADQLREQLETELLSLRDAHDAEHGHRLSLEAELQQERTAHAQLAQAHEADALALQETQHQLENERATHAETRAQLLALEEARAQVESERATHAETRAQLDAVSTERASIAEHLANTESAGTTRIAELQEALDAARDDARAALALASELEADRQSLEEARSQLVTAAEHLEEARRARDTAQSEMLGLEEARDALASQLSDAQAQLERAQADINSSGALHEDTARERDALRARVSKLEGVEALAEALGRELEAERAALSEARASMESVANRAEQIEATAQLAEEKVKVLEARETMPLSLPGRQLVGVARHGTVNLEGLARVICQLVLANVEAKLELGISGGVRTLWFKRGQIIAAESTFDAESLISRARRDGLIDGRQEEELRMVRGVPAREQLDALKNRTFIRDVEAVPLVQRFTEQVALDAFTELETQYRLADEAPGGEVLMATVPRPTLPMLTESLRRAIAPESMLEQLGGGDSILVPTDSELDLRALGFSERERKMLSWVDSEASVEDLSLASGLKPDVAFRAMLVARLLGAVEVKPGLKRSAPVDGELDVQRLEAKYEEAQDADYFTILGLTRGAGAEDVRRAFQRLSGEFDPLRFSGHPDAGLQQRAQVVANLLEEAARALEDDRRRVEYARHLLD